MGKGDSKVEAENKQVDSDGCVDVLGGVMPTVERAHFATEVKVKHRTKGSSFGFPTSGFEVAQKVGL